MIHLHPVLTPVSLTQDGLEVMIASCYLSLLSARIIDVHHHTWHNDNVCGGEGLHMQSEALYY